MQRKTVLPLLALFAFGLSADAIASAGQDFVSHEKDHMTPTSHPDDSWRPWRSSTPAFAVVSKPERSPSSASTPSSSQGKTHP